MITDITPRPGWAAWSSGQGKGDRNVSKADLSPGAAVGVDGLITVRTVRCNESGEDLDVGYNLKCYL